MARNLASFLVVGCLVIASAAVHAQGLPIPHRFAAGTDLDLVHVTNRVDGTLWAAWTWRSGAETDIAISFRKASEGFWSEPRLLGENDGNDQVQPNLAVDMHGSVYIAWAEASTGAIRVSALARGADYWTPGQIVTSRGEQAQMPALRASSESLILAYTNGERIQIREFPLIAVRPAGLAKMSDGPDPVLQQQQQWPAPSPADRPPTEDKPFDSSDEYVELLGTPNMPKAPREK